MSLPNALVVDVIIPVRNEEGNLASVLRAIPSRAARAVIVVDNGSTDGTGRVAADAGAIVVREPRPGLGAACLRGVAHVSTLPRPPDAVVFLSADGSCDPSEIPRLVEPLRENLFDLVVGSRTLGAGELGPRRAAGNFVAVHLIQALYGHKYTDLSPFRAIRYPALIALGLRDAGYGWLVEMQLKALKVGLRIAEVPVTCRRPPRRGRLSEELRGAVGTGGKTLFQIFRHSTSR